MPRRSWLLGVLVVAASPAAVSGAASDLVHACARNEGGLTRIVRSGESCRHSEHLVVWNAEGPQGPAGPAVPLGVAGPQGPAGPPGSGGGGGARKAVFEPFAVLKPIDALSPKLMLATATGKHYTKAAIEIFGEGGRAAPPILTWELTCGRGPALVLQGLLDLRRRRRPGPADRQGGGVLRPEGGQVKARGRTPVRPRLQSPAFPGCAARSPSTPSGRRTATSSRSTVSRSRSGPASS